MLAGPRALPRRANLCQHRHAVALFPSGNGCANRVPILGITFLRIATTNKSGAINPSIFCLFGFIFPKELLLWFVHHLYTGLSNGGRINDSRMVFRSVSVHSLVNAASGTQTEL